jgi:AraC-like DNA-binding protein
MGTSVRTLQRRLRATGLTYTEIAQRARCAEAQRMLKDWRPRIGDIARALGYSDAAHFTRAFQRWTGQTPRAFRGQRPVSAKRGPTRD